MKITDEYTVADNTEAIGFETIIAMICLRWVLNEDMLDHANTRRRIDYCGSYIYKNGTLDKVLFDGGYIDRDGGYNYYIKDYQGNVRVAAERNVALVASVAGCDCVCLGEAAHLSTPLRSSDLTHNCYRHSDSVHSVGRNP